MKRMVLIVSKFWNEEEGLGTVRNVTYCSCACWGSSYVPANKL